MCGAGFDIQQALNKCPFLIGSLETPHLSWRGDREESCLKNWGPCVYPSSWRQLFPAFTLRVPGPKARADFCLKSRTNKMLQGQVGSLISTVRLRASLGSGSETPLPRPQPSLSPVSALCRLPKPTPVLATSQLVCSLLLSFVQSTNTCFASNSYVLGPGPDVGKALQVSQSCVLSSRGNAMI